MKKIVKAKQIRNKSEIKVKQSIAKQVKKQTGIKKKLI